MVKILKAVFENSEQTAITVYISGDGFENLPYGVNLLLENEDDTPMHKELCNRYRAGEFSPDPYIAPVMLDEDVANEVRSKRNSLLTATDYLLMPDYPISDTDREAVKAYRQALRDITLQDGFPREVIWPEKPEVVK